MRSKREAMTLLKQVPLFSGLTAKDLGRISKECELELFSPGQNLITEGQKGGPFFVITEGRAQLIIDGKKKATLAAGNAIGEMSLIDGLPRSATVQAVTQIKALAIRSWNFQSMLEENWPITRKILIELSKRVRKMEKVPQH